VWVSWRMDETYVKVKGEWRYLYRAMDKHGQTIDFLLTEHRDTAAALRFLKKAIRRNGLPETITIDGSDANEAAIKRYNEEHGTAIAIRQVKYLNNMVEVRFVDQKPTLNKVRGIGPERKSSDARELENLLPVSV
jgi:putative transposase